MKRLTPYYAYRIYFTLREHFLNNFNIIDYNWHFLKPMEKRFYSWKGYSVFKILADDKISSTREWVNILIVIFRADPTISFEQLIEQYSYWKDESYQWQGHISNMPYVFEKECKVLMGEMFDENITFDDQFPIWLLDKLFSRKMCVETFIILKKILKIGLDGNTKYEYLYKDKYRKYELLLNINPERYRSILSTTIINEKQRRKIMKME